MCIVPLFHPLNRSPFSALCESIRIPLSFCFCSICYFTRAHTIISCIRLIRTYLYHSARTHSYSPMKLFLMFFQSLHYSPVKTVHTHICTELHMNIHKYIMIQIYTLGRFYGSIRTKQHSTNVYIRSMCIHHIFRLCVCAVCFGLCFAVHPFAHIGQCCAMRIQPNKQTTEQKHC